MKKGLFVAGLALPGLVFSTAQDQNYSIHILQKGETLSQLLQANNYKPLYGKDNWVEKVLRMNHLTADQAMKIKKGYPIILPSKEKVSSAPRAKDTVKVSMSSNALHGLVGNTISNHQDIFIDLSFFETAGEIDNKTIKQQSNFKLGFSYEDKNKRTYKKFSYNPIISFFGIGHGATEFKNDNETSATFEPTIQAQGTLLVSHPSMTYKFGPYAEILERSQLEKDNESFDVRRDRFLNIGAMATQRFEVDHLVYDIKASISSTLASQNLNNYETMSMVTARFSADVNLTREYFIGAFWRNDYFGNTAQ